MKLVLFLFFLTVLCVSCNATSIFSLREETDSTSEQWAWPKPKVELNKRKILLLPPKEEFMDSKDKFKTMVQIPLDQTLRLPYYKQESLSKVDFSVARQGEKTTHIVSFPSGIASIPPILAISPTSFTPPEMRAEDLAPVFQNVPLKKQAHFPFIPHQTLKKKSFPELNLNRPMNSLPTVFIPPPAEEQLVSSMVSVRDKENQEAPPPSSLSWTSLPKARFFVATNNPPKDPHPQMDIASALPVSLSLPSYSDSNEKPSKTELMFPKTPLKKQLDFPWTSYFTLKNSTFLAEKLSAKAPRPQLGFIPRPLDIILVIDTSLSMQKRLSGFHVRFASFLSQLSHLNWKLMITDADHGETWFPLFNIIAHKGSALQLERAGQILNFKYLSPDVYDYNSVFLSSISLHKRGEYTVLINDETRDLDPCALPPGCQSYKEQPLKSLKSALIKNRDFFRKEADLAVVLISNSQERAGQEFATTPEEVIRQFEEQHGTKKRFEVYGLIITEEDEDCLQENLEQQNVFPEVAVSLKIMALSDMTGGEVFSLCSPDYQALALSIADSFGNPP